jgi:lipid-A-disaccharide synthase-like uncharacterized protein
MFHESQGRQSLGAADHGGDITADTPIRRHALGGVLAYGRAGVRCLSCQAPHSMRYGPMEWLDPSALLALVVVTPWKIVGWSGSAIFSIRFFLQWIASERAKKSIIPIGFWECSVLGSLLALGYFAIYRRDSVGVLMTLAPLPLYIRNLYLKWREVLAEKRAKKLSATSEKSQIATR